MTNILDSYRAIVGSEVLDELGQIARILKGVKILHVNSTRYGGGVAEILSVMTQLSNALGIETSWETLQGTPEFFQCTKGFHNALQGRKEIIFSPSLFDVYKKVNSENADLLRSKLERADVVFIHDPQPAALISSFPNRKNRWIWRCHIALASPKRSIWNFLRQYVTQYDASIFSLPDYVEPLPHPAYVIPPSIDPLSEKNMDLSEAEIAEVYPKFNIDPHRPVILQVSRFDRFKDPVGVIKAYREAKKFRRGLQLVLAGGGAFDDPEGAVVLEEVRKEASEDPDIHVLLLPDDAHKTINALQRVADIVLQKSLREGFGLTVTEALWKRKPVIGGNCGGIRLQVSNHHTGFLVNSPEGAALRIRYLFQNPDVAKRLGDQGHQLVLDNFLMTRHLREYLTLIISLLHPGGRIELGRMGL
jgi:trehalose synthase